ncbi:FAD/NAD(P)-binding domain-containing protein [Stemphylium lycopersici]|uniref:FAD/NAD(P)-binding domain-containing protein n=1 Tax=Stemphylium lycopersici TaxID=183478 RepID=A0A364MWA4_STELY|nr:FAD/NAD(P)-binding domain-containing protein [Stemphylium lycopersici]
MAPSDTKSQKPFRIIIVGAGIVGLSLSHALQLAGIDHVVLEKHHEIVSLRGAEYPVRSPGMRVAPLQRSTRQVKIDTSSRVERIEHTKADYEPGGVSESDKEVMTSQFQAIFSVSTQEEKFDLGPADSHVILGHDDAGLLFTQPGKAYWAVIFKDEYKKPALRTKATEADIEAVAKKYANRPMTEKVALGDLWNTNTRHGLLTFEEGVLSKWHAGRLVLVGDSVHKMTADIGLGAHMAIESAFQLCNILQRELKSNPNRHPSSSELSAFSAEYQAGRYERVTKIVDVYAKATRMHTYQTYSDRFFAGYVAPYLASVRAIKFAEIMAHAPKLDYAPTRMTKENAKDWKLAQKREENSSWMLYGVLTLGMGMALTYLVRVGLLL